MKNHRAEELDEVDHFQAQMTTMLEKTIGKVDSTQLKSFKKLSYVSQRN